MKSSGFGVRVTALALALVLPTTAFAAPPEAAAAPEGAVAPIEITPAPLPADAPASEAPALPPADAPLVVPPIAPPPPVLVHADPLPPPIDERALYRKKLSPGIVMTAVGFGSFGIAYLLGLATMGLADAAGTSGEESGVTDDFALPLAGPFISASHANNRSDRVTSMIPGIVQIAGVAVGITGVAMIAKVKRQHPNGRVSLGGGGLLIRF